MSCPIGKVLDYPVLFRDPLHRVLVQIPIVHDRRPAGEPRVRAVLEKDDRVGLPIGRAGELRFSVLERADVILVNEDFLSSPLRAEPPPLHVAVEGPGRDFEEFRGLFASIGIWHSLWQIVRIFIGLQARSSTRAFS